MYGPLDLIGRLFDRRGSNLWAGVVPESISGYREAVDLIGRHGRARRFPTGLRNEHPKKPVAVAMYRKVCMPDDQVGPQQIDR